MTARKVIFDTDPGIDDACALALVAASPALELVGITSVFGNAPVGTTTRNALYLRRRYGLAAPVARGAARPLACPPRDFPAFIHGENGLGDFPLPGLAETGQDPADRPHALDAAHFIVEQLRAAPGEITLIAVGPLTNLALALDIDPGIASLVAEVVVMGGAFGTAGRPGNVSPVAEANIYNDPHAADRVFHSDHLHFYISPKIHSFIQGSLKTVTLMINCNIRANRSFSSKAPIFRAVVFSFPSSPPPVFHFDTVFLKLNPGFSQPFLLFAASPSRTRTSPAE